jgi:plasmid stability protein
MSKVIQIRRVPDAVHRTLKARAAEAGMSLSAFLLDEFRKIAETPSRQQLIERLSRLPPVRMRPRAADAVRAERRLR